MRLRSFFVTGTDTGVGKTVVSCLLLSELRSRGYDAGGFKAIETGVGPEGPADALALQAASGDVDSLDEVCPQRFALPAAPSVAAAREGRSVSLEAIEKAFQTMQMRRSPVVVEGAGGLLVPIDANFDMADLAAQLSLPVLVVCRAALGTINHTLLSLAEIQRRGLELLGVVISHADPQLSPADGENLGELRRQLGRRLIGEVPYRMGGGAPDSSSLRIEELIEKLLSDRL